MREKSIFYCEIENCFVQIEEMMFPELKKFPLVLHDHHQVIGKNKIADQYGIMVGDSLLKAQKKCLNLVVVEPHYEDYCYYIEETKNIFRHYTDNIQNDETGQFWSDISDSKRLFGNNLLDIAKKIQKRIDNEIGLKVKIGISFNQAYAKMACHVFRQPLNFINKNRFLNYIYPLPIQQCVEINQKDAQILNLHHIVTVEDLMMRDKENLYNLLGNEGEWLWNYVHGIIEDKNDWDKEKIPQSIGQSLTVPYEIYTYQQAKSMIHVLINDVVKQLHDYHLEGSKVSLTLRDYEMKSISRYFEFDTHTQSYDDILWVSEDLIEGLCVGSFCGHLDRPYRNMTLSISNLKDVRCSETQENWDYGVETVQDYLNISNRDIQSLSLQHQFA